MAMNTYLFLEADGNAIQGDPLVQSVGGLEVEDSIEAMAFYHEVATATESTTSSTARTSGRSSHGPISFVKRIDRSTPILLDAWANNRRIDGVIKFFRNNSDSGIVEKHYEITITNGRITSDRTEMMNNNFQEGAAVPVLERVSITYETIEWEFNGPSGTTSAAAQLNATV